MAHGACDPCGNAYEECECKDQPVRGKRRKPKPKPVPVKMGFGDWVRVKRGHALAGAAGSVKHVDRSTHPALVRFRQLNGHELRLPLGMLEFVGYAGSEPDVL